MSYTGLFYTFMTFTAGQYSQCVTARVTCLQWQGEGVFDALQLTTQANEENMFTFYTERMLNSEKRNTANCIQRTFPDMQFVDHSSMMLQNELKCILDCTIYLITNY